jgi:hypothetical protein
MGTFLEDNVYANRARWECGGEDRRTVVRLGDPASGGNVEIGAGSEPLRAGDAVTVVLPPRKRVRLAGWLRAPRVAAVTLAVLGSGVSIRLLRRPGGHGGVRSGATAQHHLAGAPSTQRKRGAARSAHYRVGASTRRGAGGQRRAVRRVGSGERARASRSASSVPARVRPVPVTPTAGYVPQGGAGPAVDEAPARVPSEPQSAPVLRRRPPCLPGTLGC